ncbi:MAG: STAS domain-containing protein [Herbaspirillum sp.]
MKAQNLAIDGLLQQDEGSFIRDWLTEAYVGGSLAANEGLAAEAALLLSAFREGVRADGDAERFDDPAWSALREALATLSSARAAQGVSAGDTNRFVLAMKKPFFAGLQENVEKDPVGCIAAVWALSKLVDNMTQYMSTVYQRSREDIIRRQQQELLELSTPVVKLWDGVLAVPMIGTLDSSRTQIVMETLLQRIVESGAELAIIDITGVPTVDTLVAQHLLKTVTAIRLMGADCIISGIRPQIAQTIVHLGIDLQGIITKATLADALAQALKITGYAVSRKA